MKTIDRRDFLKMAGAGSVVVVAGVAMPVAGYFGWTNKDILRFRAFAGMPKAPLPEYASYVIEGQADLHARTGQLAKSIHAGAPDAMSGAVFPGTARTDRLTDVQQSGNHASITGERRRSVVCYRPRGIGHVNDGGARDVDRAEPQENSQPPACHSQLSPETARP